MSLPSRTNHSSNVTLDKAGFRCNPKTKSHWRSSRLRGGAVFPLVSTGLFSRLPLENRVIVRIVFCARPFTANVVDIVIRLLRALIGTKISLTLFRSKDSTPLEPCPDIYCADDKSGWDRRTTQKWQ